jgi:hypothetical protein
MNHADKRSEPSSLHSPLYVSMAGIIGQNKTPLGNMVSRCVEYPVIESPLYHFSDIDYHPYCLSNSL